MASSRETTLPPGLTTRIISCRVLTRSGTRKAKPMVAQSKLLSERVRRWHFPAPVLFYLSMDDRISGRLLSDYSQNPGHDLSFFQLFWPAQSNFTGSRTSGTASCRQLAFHDKTTPGIVRPKVMTSSSIYLSAAKTFGASVSLKQPCVDIFITALSI